MKKKECFKCGETKPLSEFYKHKQMADGHLNKCKECAKRDVAKHRSENREKIHAYDVARSKTKERRTKVREYQRNMREADPERYKARYALNNAVRDKKIEKPKKCDCCGKRRKLQGHHHDYSKPLDVRWLCFKCHREEEHHQIVTSDHQ